MELSDWFKGFEKGIAKLTAEQREQFFSECGKHCVQCGTLQVYKELYEKANGDMEVFFSEANELPGVRCETIEKGSVYDLYFMECTCRLHKQGMFRHLCFVNAPGKAFFMFCSRCGMTEHSESPFVNPFYEEACIARCGLKQVTPILLNLKRKYRME